MIRNSMFAQMVTYAALAYDSSFPMDDLKSNLQHRFGERIRDVYKSPIIDISVGVRKEMSGYFPSVKRMYSEYVIYDKYSNDP